MFNQKVRVRIRKFHRWAAVLIGIQLTMWVVSGIYFAWISIEDIRGDSNRLESSQSSITVSELFALKDLEIPAAFLIKKIKLDSSPRGFIIRVESTEEKILSFEARSGRALPLLTAKEAEAIGLTQIKDRPEILKSELVDERAGEYKGPVPAYRIQLDDRLSTRLYVDPWSGRLLVQRNNLWRIYDFLWMLHIMDYSNREDFNNRWLKIASAASLTIVISGYMLFWFGRARPKRRQ